MTLILILSAFVIIGIHNGLIQGALPTSLCLGAFVWLTGR